MTKQPNRRPIQRSQFDLPPKPPQDIRTLVACGNVADWFSRYARWYAKYFKD